jgi:hypothetical protein
MKMRSVILPLLLSVAAAAPAAAYTYREPTPVASHELNKFVGTNLHGRGWSNIGIVAAVSRPMGTIAVVGRHGEVATVDKSMLVRAGLQLQAPELTTGDIARRSYSGMNRVPLSRGEIIIEESSTYFYDEGE